HYKLGLSQVEARLVEFKNQEIKFCEKIRGLEFKVESRTDRMKSLTKELEELKKEKEGLDTKLIGFQTASKDLDNLLESQRTDKNKEGLGYCTVPPPPAQVYSPPKKDMSWKGLPEFADDSITDYSRPLPTIESLSQVEARLVEFKKQEIKLCEKIRGLEFDVKNKNNKIKRLMNELEQVKKEKKGLDSKLTGFKSAFKDLDTLLGSQRSNKNKEGLGYSVVPPPAQVYSSLKKDMSWTGLLKFTDDTITDYNRPSPSI
nr:hypothetical protein [Tanacetum cinerariifolium]